MQIPVHHATSTHAGAAASGAPARKPANPVANASSNSSSNSSDSSTSSATVTANDFLELLVTEMKNQDPTANTDPNEYINQLVQVNSLEQLIQINQDLGSSGGGSSSSVRIAQGNLSPNVSGSSNLGHSNLTDAAQGVASALAHPSDAPAESTPSPSESQLPSRLFTALKSAARL